MNTLSAGAVGGAAGTMALDLASYLDMTVRGRAPSSTPAEVVRRLADRAGNGDLAKPDAESNEATNNRRSALGSLSGYGIGIGIGLMYGVGGPLASRIPLGAKALILAGIAMAASDVPATMLGATDPKKWGAAGWIADILPHLAYGFVTAAVVDAAIGDSHA